MEWYTIGIENYFKITQGESYCSKSMKQNTILLFSQPIVFGE